MLEKAIDFSHSLLKKTVVPGDIVIDATVGKGNDSLLLASLVGPSGKVIGFDIQEQAIKQTKEKFLLTGLSERLELHQTSHEHAHTFIPENKAIGGVIYNLGYLPGGDKSITTTYQSTLTSIKHLLPLLRVGSLMVLVVYSGHPNGLKEKEMLLNYVSGLNQTDYTVLSYQFINQQNHPPFVIAIEKRKQKHPL